jgi:hypothetical protein
MTKEKSIPLSVRTQVDIIFRDMNIYSTRIRTIPRREEVRVSKQKYFQAKERIQIELDQEGPKLEKESRKGK